MNRRRAVGRFALTCIAYSLFPFSVPGQESSGKIQGLVTDPGGSPVPSAYVSATSQTLPRGLNTVTDDRGLYAFPQVPVGNFTVTVIAPGFHTLRYHSLDVKLGGNTTFNARLSLGALADSIEVNESLASLDMNSSRTSTNITASEFDKIAHGRSFHTILMMSPGVRQEVRSGSAGVGGIQVDGASGSENAYYIDGVEVSDLMSGALRPQNSIPLDFIKELEIKSGGFEAEFGGATGGVVNVATRGGSNEVHGEAAFQATGATLNAGDRGFYQRNPTDVNLAEMFRPKQDAYHIFYPGGSIGGPILRDRLYFFGSYMPELEHTSRAIDYADGSRVFQQDRIRHYALSRLDYSPHPSLQLNASYVWSPFKRLGALPSRDPRIERPHNDLSSLGELVPSQTFSAAASYSVNSRLLVNTRYGYKYLNDKANTYGVSGLPYLYYHTASSSVPGVPDAYAGAAGFQTAVGVFGVEKSVTSRNNLYTDLSYVTSIGGRQHIFKTGYSLNRVFNDISDGYPNGSFQIFWGDSFSRGSFTNERGRYGYYIFDDGPRHNSRALGRNMGLYLQDAWRVSSRLTVNLGTRVENEFLPPYRQAVNGVKVANPVAFGWGDKIAPRLGTAWDVRGDGRWKLSASFGLFYDVMKYTLARTMFGGEYWMSHVYRLDNPDVGLLGKGNPGLLGAHITTYDNRLMRLNSRGELDGIDPNLKPYTTRELTLALDRKLSSRLDFALRYTRKDLIRAIEDIGVLDGADNEVYVLGNPGYGLTRNPASVYGGKTPNGREWLVPRARRQYDALEFRLQGHTDRLNALASYTWSRLYGNYSGLANSDEAGRSDPNISRAFDLPYYYFDSSGSQRNVDGRLSTDRPHTFKLFGWYALKHRFGSTNLGITQVAMSGGIDSTSVNYLTAPTFPFGRGDMGRMPIFTQTDLNLSHQLKLRDKVSMKLEATATNLLNQATVISRVTQLNRQGNITASQLPPSQFFAGYKVSDFVTPSSLTSPYNAIYGLPGTDSKSDLSSAFLTTYPGFGAYQGPRTLRLGLRLIF